MCVCVCVCVYVCVCVPHNPTPPPLLPSQTPPPLLPPHLTTPPLLPPHLTTPPLLPSSLLTSCSTAFCRTNTNPNIPNMKKIADLYAEVIGILSQARFLSVRRRFFQEIRDPHHRAATIASIIEGLSFVRIKMFPVEETEQWFAFLQVGFRWNLHLLQGGLCLKNASIYIYENSHYLFFTHTAQVLVIRISN